jgi:acetone carboxylase gamma subunit
MLTAKPVSPDQPRGKLASNARPVMRIHESLDVVADGDDFSVCCRTCSQDLGPATGNYKAAAVYRVVPKDEMTELPPPEARKSMGAYVEYYCPGCATLLDVETSCPAVEGDKLEPIWDIALTERAVRKAAARADRMPVAAE